MEELDETTIIEGKCDACGRLVQDRPGRSVLTDDAGHKYKVCSQRCASDLVNCHELEIVDWGCGTAFWDYQNALYELVKAKYEFDKTQSIY